MIICLILIPLTVIRVRVINTYAISSSKLTRIHFGKETSEVNITSRKVSFMLVGFHNLKGILIFILYQFAQINVDKTLRPSCQHAHTIEAKDNKPKEDAFIH